MRAEPSPYEWPSASFLTRLGRAIQDGILWGVKLGLALALTLIALSYVFGDYSIVRQRALNGQRAFEYLQQAMAAQAKKDTP